MIHFLHFEKNRKALTFPDSCNEILRCENSSCSTPCTSKNHICQCFGMGVSPTVTRRKAFEHAKTLYLNKIPRKKAIFRNTKDLPKYSVLEVFWKASQNVPHGKLALTV